MTMSAGRRLDCENLDDHRSQMKSDDKYLWGLTRPWATTVCGSACTAQLRLRQLRAGRCGDRVYSF